MYHDVSHQGQKRDLSKRFILTSAILLSPCAFNIRAAYIWVWLQDHKQKCSNQQSILYRWFKIVREELARTSWRTENSKTIQGWYRYGIWPWEMKKFKKGKVTSSGNIVIDEDTEIQELDQEGIYKYLGVDESDGIQHSKMKEQIRKEYNSTGRQPCGFEAEWRQLFDTLFELLHCLSFATVNLGKTQVIPRNVS